MSRGKPTDQRKGTVRKNVDWKALEIVYPDAAGIDVGGHEHWVCAKHKVRGLGTGRFPDVHLHNVLGLVRLTTWPRSFPCANS
jgi:hypothetical protein